MTRTELIGLANFAGYDVDEDDDVHAPASGRYGLDPKLVRFAQLVSDSMALRKKTKFYEQGYEAGKIDEREACAKICEEFVLGDPHAAAIRERSV